MSSNKPFAFQAGDRFWAKRAKGITKGGTGKAGRPCTFDSPEVLKNACYEYFDYEHKRTWSKPEAIKGGEFAGQLVNVTVKTPFTIQGLCIFLGVNTKYLNDFEDKIRADKKRIDAKPSAEVTKDDTDLLLINAEFSEVITHVRDIIDKQKLEGAMIGAFHATITSQLIGLSTKTQTELSGPNGAPIETEGKLIVEILSTGVGLSKTEQEIQDAVSKELGG